MKVEVGYIEVAPKEYNDDYHRALASSLMIVTGRVIETRRNNGTIPTTSDVITLANVVRILREIDRDPSILTKTEDTHRFLSAIINTGVVYKEDGSLNDDFKEVPTTIKQVLSDPQLDSRYREALLEAITKSGDKYFDIMGGNLDGISNIEDLIRVLTNKSSVSYSTSSFEIPELENNSVLYPIISIPGNERGSYTFLTNVIRHLIHAQGNQISLESKEGMEIDLEEIFKPLGTNSSKDLKTKLTRVFGGLFGKYFLNGDPFTFQTSSQDQGLKREFKVRYKEGFYLVFRIDYFRSPEVKYSQYSGFSVNNIKRLEIALEKKLN